MKRVWLEFMTMISVETSTFQGRSPEHRLATPAAVCQMSFTLWCIFFPPSGLQREPAFHYLPCCCSSRWLLSLLFKLNLHSDETSFNLTHPEGSFDFFTLGDSRSHTSRSVRGHLDFKSLWVKREDPAEPTRTKVGGRTPCRQENSGALLGRGYKEPPCFDGSLVWRLLKVHVALFSQRSLGERWQQWLHRTLRRQTELWRCEAERSRSRLRH